MHKKVYLVLGPHTDDGEWGCGASIVKWIKEGHTVHYAAFSAAEESVPDGLPPDILRKEIVDAIAVLGIAIENLKVFTFRVRHFPRDRQEILETMVGLRKQIKPDVVAVPSSFDTHQDHEVISQEAFRAFKRCTILGYEIPWNNRRIDLTFFNGVDRICLDAKVASIAAYKSQIFRAPNFPDLINSLAIQRGSQVGLDFAEAFEVIRWVEN
ncbi:MAG: PIG-L deacetylase family protein [Acidovorax temperans]|uniref:PIG-L deacetylase family protein n=1 Tax=Acidovorax temperans TaxID=80878 RepID=UPI00391CAC04